MLKAADDGIFRDGEAGGVVVLGFNLLGELVEFFFRHGVVDVAEGVGENGPETGFHDVSEDDVNAVGDELGCFVAEAALEGFKGVADEDGVVGEGV